MVGVYHVDGKTDASEQMYACGRLLVRSVHKSMRGVKVVHFTDLTSRPIKGVDDVRRKPSEPMALLRMRHHAGVTGEWVFVDTDVCVRRSVQHVFEKPFDIALTTRNWHHLKQANGFAERMPYNTGVVFSRCPAFWGEVYTRLRREDDEAQHWMGDQQVIGDMAESDTCRYGIRKVWGSKYNFPPAVGKDDNHALSLKMQQDAAILHYKGPARKAMMLRDGIATCA
jgi:hypothetical protein